MHDGSSRLLIATRPSDICDFDTVAHRIRKHGLEWLKQTFGCGPSNTYDFDTVTRRI